MAHGSAKFPPACTRALASNCGVRSRRRVVRTAVVRYSMEESQRSPHGVLRVRSVRVRVIPPATMDELAFDFERGLEQNVGQPVEPPPSMPASGRKNYRMARASRRR